MKTKALLSTAALCAAFLFSCQKQDNVPPVRHGDNGNINLLLRADGAATKAASNVNESALTDVQVLVFNTENELYRHYSLTAEEMAGRSCELTNFKIGTYSMYVVANGPDLSEGVGTKAELLATPIELGAYNGPSSDFVMCGMKEGVVVTADNTTPVTVEISRYVSRITLSSIKNNLPKSPRLLRHCTVDSQAHTC